MIICRAMSRLVALHQSFHTTVDASACPVCLIIQVDTVKGTEALPKRAGNIYRHTSSEAQFDCITSNFCTQHACLYKSVARSKHIFVIEIGATLCLGGAQNELRRPRSSAQCANTHTPYRLTMLRSAEKYINLLHCPPCYHLYRNPHLPPALFCTDFASCSCCHCSPQQVHQRRCVPSVPGDFRCVRCFQHRP